MAIGSALSQTAPRDHPELLEWVAERGLLGLARSAGFDAAAASAYRMADELAGVLAE